VAIVVVLGICVLHFSQFKIIPLTEFSLFFYRTAEFLS